jgi:hypothetical protein
MTGSPQITDMSARTVSAGLRDTQARSNRRAPTGTLLHFSRNVPSAALTPSWCPRMLPLGQLVRVQADLLDEELANAIVLVHAASLPDWMLRVLAIVAIMERIVADLV